MLTKQYDQLIRDTVLDGWNEKRLSVLQCAFAAVEAVLAQRTEPAPAQEHLGADRTDEWESRMDAQKQAAQPITQSAGNNSSGAEQINVPQCTAPVQQSVGTDELQRIQMTAALAAARPVIEAERDKQWSAWGIVEVAVRNQSVADYMKHWEERATKAEANADFLRRSVGAVHMMISRNDLAELDGDWGTTELPPRLKKYIEEARKGLHSEAEIRAAMLQRWPRLGKRLAEDLFTILNAHKEERVMRVCTSFVNPPIPIRVFDWVAWIDGEEENGHYGYGRTEQEAKDELTALQMQFDEENATGRRAEIREGKQ
jgi:hypothetical protein